MPSRISRLTSSNPFLPFLPLPPLITFKVNHHYSIHHHTVTQPGAIALQCTVRRELCIQLIFRSMHSLCLPPFLCTQSQLRRRCRKSLKGSLSMEDQSDMLS